jgi:hypothetical protein
MPTLLSGLLVGEHFRPPAKLILANLPAKTELRLELENDNPYDAHAVRVLVLPSKIPESRFETLAAQLPEYGATLEQVLSSGPIWLGYVAASEGKPLKTAQVGDPSLVGNQEFRAALEANDEYKATLGFGLDERARVGLTVEVDPQEAPPEDESEDEEEEEES